MKCYVVGKGRIRGTYCDSFHSINEDGTIGGYYARKMAPSEREQVLTDIQRHREILMGELEDLDNAEKVLNTTYQVTSFDW